MLIEEAIQRVQSGYSKGLQSDDTRLSSRHIYSKLKTVRARLLVQKINKKQAISDWSFQTIPCVELEKVPIHDCPCIPPNGCYIYRSKTPLPEVVVGINGFMFRSVSSLDGRIVYSPTTWEDMKNLSGNKYTAKYQRYFVRNDYLYTLDTKHRVVSVTGLFQDPLIVDDYPIFCEETATNCTAYDKRDFNVSNALGEIVIEMTIRELLEVFLRSKEDLTNNARDSNKQESK